ncbi:MAG: hypothetical protein B9S32_14575 [Verrucomicrobia bacterium Tous-C9LFEB]|nr:MAG: hypothetical protein B9S32_14575 [Verrucomicrobia bacterium Tous-C9LFEB]
MKTAPSLSVGSLAVTVLLALTIVLAKPVQASILITDDFTISSGRTLDGALSGVTTEVGGATWSAYSNVVFEENAGNGYITPNTSGGTRAQVAFSASSGILSLSANIDTGATGWTGLGFLNQSSSNLYTTTGGQFWVLLSSSGSATVYQGTTSLKTAAAPSFSSSSFNMVQLDYDFSAAIVSVTINGSLFYSATSSYVPTINYARIEWNSPTALDAQVDSFSASAVPEPSMVLLMGLAASGFLLVRLMRKERFPLSPK